MNAKPAQPFARDDGPILFGHRGDRANYPENTLLAMEKSVAYGIDALELDIHMTADGVPVVIHDETVNRTTDGNGPVREFTLDELKALDAGYWYSPDNGQTYPFRGAGLTIPTVSEVFEAFPDLWINIDIKHHKEEIIAPFVQTVRDHGMAQNVLVGSFDTETLHQFRAAFPEVVTATTPREIGRLLLSGLLRLGRFYSGTGRAAQVPEKYGGLPIVTRRFIETAHENDVAVHVWTVDDKRDMQRLYEMGVDGLISNHPLRLLEQFGRR